MKIFVTCYLIILSQFVKSEQETLTEILKDSNIEFVQFDERFVINHKSKFNYYFYFE